MLKKARLLEQAAEGPGQLQWRDFRSAPSASKKSEKGVFIGIAYIANKLVSYTLQHSEDKHSWKKSRVQYLDCPDNPIASEIPGANFKNDACFMLKRQSRLYSAAGMLACPNIAVVIEYKKNLKDETDVGTYRAIRFESLTRFR